MRVRILLQIAGDDGADGDAIEAAVFDKQAERPEDIGMSIAEGKTLMAAVQQRIVDAQVALSLIHISLARQGCRRGSAAAVRPARSAW